MSAPEATGVRQRTTERVPLKDDTPNPTSLGTKSNANVVRDGKKPVVKPPFIDVPMGRFMVYLSLALLALMGFYTWRFTVWAAEAGGYWALFTGRHVDVKAVKASASASSAIASASSAASAASGSASSVSGKARKSAAGAASAVTAKGKSAVKSAAAASTESDVQSQIVALAAALGIKPAELSNAIRPLIDPSVPNPAEAAQKELELLKLQIQAGGMGAGAGAGAGTGAPLVGSDGSPVVPSPEAVATPVEKHAGILNVLGEALLD